MRELALLQIRAFQIGLLQNRAGKIRASQVRHSQIRLEQIGALAAGLAQKMIAVRFETLRQRPALVANSFRFAPTAIPRDQIPKSYGLTSVDDPPLRIKRFDEAIARGSVY